MLLLTGGIQHSKSGTHPTSHRKCWTLALSGFTTNQTGAFAPREIRLVQQTVYSRAIPSYQLRSECAAVGFPRPNRLPSGVGGQNRRPAGTGAHQSALYKKQGCGRSNYCSKDYIRTTGIKELSFFASHLKTMARSSDQLDRRQTQATIQALRDRLSASLASIKTDYELEDRALEVCEVRAAHLSHPEYPRARMRRQHCGDTAGTAKSTSET